MGSADVVSGGVGRGTAGRDVGAVRPGAVGWRPPRPVGRLLPGALLSVVLMQVLRVWSPSLVLVGGRDPLASGLRLAAFAVACLVLPVLLVAAADRLRVGRTLVVCAVVLVAARAVLQLAPGGVPQMVVAAVGTVGGVAAFVAWVSTVDGHLGRLAVLAGVVAESVIHLALGTLDLTWRTGAWPVALTTLLVLTTLLAALSAAGRAERRATASAAWAGPAWPWLAVGPLVVLVAMVSAAPGRAALATGWSPALVAGTLAAGHALAVVVALAARRWGPTGCGTTGAGLVLVGTAGSLRPAGALAMAAQVALAIGVGLAVGALAGAVGDATRRRSAAAVVTGWLGAVLLLVGYHLWHQLPTPGDVRYLLVVAAAVLAALALLGARPYAPAVEGLPTPPRTSRAVAAVVAVALVAAGSAVATVPGPVGPPGDAAGAGELSVALLNVRLGYDHRGRFAPTAQADALAELDPDVVVLNEVDRGWMPAGGHDTHRLLGDRLGLAGAFAPVGDWLRGHAVLTDLPLAEVQHQRLPPGPRVPDTSLLSAVVGLGGGRSVAVLTTQLHPVEHDVDVRRRQARAVAAEVARQRARGLEVVLLGDLQAEQRAAELEPVEDLLRPAVPAGRATWPAQRPRRQLDHVLVSERLEVADWTIASAEVSDHLPLAVRLRLTEPADDAS